MKALLVAIPFATMVEILEKEHYGIRISTFSELVRIVLDEVVDGAPMNDTLRDQITNAICNEIRALLAEPKPAEKAEEISPDQAFLKGQAQAVADVIELLMGILDYLAPPKGKQVLEEFEARVVKCPLAILVEDPYHLVNSEVAFLAGQQKVRKASMEILSAVLEELGVEGRDGIHTAYRQALADLPLVELAKAEAKEAALVEALSPRLVNLADVERILDELFTPWIENGVVVTTDETDALLDELERRLS